MKGKIIKYVEEKGFGFILDEKARKRFFHISDTLNPLKVKEQLFVEFEPHESEKGLSSRKIRVTNSDIKAKFINIYDTNIKCSNIKQFGISEGTEEFYRKKAHGLFGKQGDKLYRLEDIPEDQGPYSIAGTVNLDAYDLVLVPYNYLYVTTYQGDNYLWKDTMDSLKKNLKYLEDSFSL